jgi:predicted HicB family RNase H-like nuclease
MDNYIIFGQLVEYKGYTGSIEYSFKDDVFYGKLLNTNDLVNYEGKDLFSLYNNYLEAIDDYIKIKVTETTLVSKD